MVLILQIALLKAVFYVIATIAAIARENVQRIIVIVWKQLFSDCSDRSDLSDHMETNFKQSTRIVHLFWNAFSMCTLQRFL